MALWRKNPRSVKAAVRPLLVAGRVAHAGMLMLAFCAAAAAAPPVSLPQGCAPTYCFEVIATAPDQPRLIRIESTVPADAATSTVDLGRGFAVGFHSRYVENGATVTGLSVPAWKRSERKATAVVCLTCSVPGASEVLGIALWGIPGSYDEDLSGISVCVWPLDRSSVAHGDGRVLRLGEKVCI